ncbi:MAG TPA: 3D domain-containing protein [Chthoniobacterales bacterium]|jgi:3D (Asp-Asp-Asp) domain-containing protein
MPAFPKLVAVAAIACLIAGCETPAPQKKSTATARRVSHVRTTAYTHSEKGGHRNAIGTSLSRAKEMSAASDWSRFPLGTRFRIVGTEEHYIIDDYGGALIGTNTIDLYKTNKFAMRQWGVRMVDIDILEWGSKQQSLKVLTPRRKNRLVRRMIAGLEAK